MTQQLYPCLWFQGQQANAAAEFYCSVFPYSKINSATPVVVMFELNGKPFMGLNSGQPKNNFNESCSFVIPCDTQEEIDHYWSKLIASGGTESKCGWCKDRFGVWWQVVPSMLGELMSHPEKGQRVVQAFLKMTKFDIEKLKNA